MSASMATPDFTIQSNPIVFIDTNLKTYLVIPVTDNDTVFDLKEKIISEHPRCFPMYGKLDVTSIKVKRKKCFYHLSDSALVKNVFYGVNRTWYLYVDAVSELVDGLSAETKKTNVQLDRQCIKVSGLESNTGIANHVILSEGQFVQGDVGGEVSNKLDLGVQILSSELIKSSDDANERLISGKRKRSDPISTEKEIPEIHVEHKKDESINDKGGNTLGEAPQLKSPEKKKRRKEKNSEDVSESVKGLSDEARHKKDEFIYDKGGMDENTLAEALQPKSPEKKKRRKEKNSEDVSKNVEGLPDEAWRSVSAVNNDKILDALHDPVGKSVKEIDNETLDKVTSKPENLRHEPFGDEQQVTSAGLPIKPGESLVREKRKKKKKSTRVQNEVTSPIETENEAPQMHNEHKKDGLVDDAVGESMEEIDAGRRTTDKVSSKPENLIHEKPLGNELQVTGAGLPVESSVREKGKKKNKKLASVRNEASNVDTKNEVPEMHIEHKKDELTNSLHDPVEDSMKGMDAGTPLHGKHISKPKNLLLEKPLGDEQHVTSACLPIKPVESIVSEKRKKKPTRIQEDVNSIAKPSKRKLLDASVDTEAKDIADTRKKKKRTTKTSDAETCLPSSGAENDDRPRDIVPVTSKPEIAHTDHPSRETKKAGKSLPPSGKSRASKVRTIAAPSPCLEKGSDKDCEIGDNTLLMESLKTKQNPKSFSEPPKEQEVGLSRDLTTSADGNRKQENTPSKKVKRSRIGKTMSDDNSKYVVAEVGKSGGTAVDPLSQVSENYEPLQMPSDILGQNAGKRPLEENYESDVNGSTNENTKSSGVERDDIDFSESDKVQVSKDERNNPAPQPNMKATVGVDETPVEVSKKKVVSESGNATPVISHLDSSSRVNFAEKKINVALAESSSDSESTVGRVNKNNGGVVPQSHAKARIPLSNQIGKVLNASNSQRSLLTSIKPIFKENSDESSQDIGDDVNNSEASTQTPSDSSSSGSSTGEDSPGPSGGRRMDSNLSKLKVKKNASLDTIFKSAKSYKKAKDVAVLSQPEAVDFVLDTED